MKRTKLIGIMGPDKILTSLICTMRPVATLRTLLRSMLLIAVMATFMNAAATEYLIMPVTLDQGLTQSSANCVLRDRKGYLWIGTDFGLNRYDNHKVTNYFHEPDNPYSIPDNQIVYMTIDNNGDLLIGCARGVARYNYLNNNFEQLQVDGETIETRSALPTTYGTIIGGFGRLYYYDSDTREISRLPAKGGIALPYLKIQPWKPGTYILQTRWDGLWVYDSTNDDIERLSFINEKNVQSIYVDSANQLWLSIFGQGLCCYNRSGKLLCEMTTDNSLLSSNMVLAMEEFEGKLWVGTEKGFNIIDIHDYTISKLDSKLYGPRHFTIICLSSDNDNAIYAGTLRHGVMCIYKVPMRTFTNMGNTPSTFGFTVTSILADGDSENVWLGIDGEGVALFDPHNETFKHYPSTDNLKITSIARYDANHLIISAYEKGIKLLNTVTGHLTAAPPVFDKIHRQCTDNGSAIELYNAGNGLIISVSDSICTIDSATGEIKVAKFNGIRAKSQKLHPFYFDGKKLLTRDRHNIFRYDISSDTCGIVFSANPDETILAAAYDGNDKGWIATNKSLMGYEVSTGEITHHGSDLLRNINSLAVEGDRLWIGADNQLFMMYGDVMSAFGPQDGMSPNQFIDKAYLLTDDYVLLGGVNGMLKINRQDIDALIAAPANSDFSVSDIYVDDALRHLDAEGRLVIPYGHKKVAIDIIDHDNSGIRNKLFRYSVDGLKRDISIETFNRKFTLERMPPGVYQVYTEYSVNNDNWSEPKLMMEIVVENPWWQSWWAILLFLLIGFGTFVGAYMLYKGKRQKKMETIRHNALVDKVNFLTRVHTDLRTPLTLIMSPLGSLIERLKSSSDIASLEDKDETIAALEDIYHNSQQMRDIIDTLPENTELTGVVNVPNGAPGMRAPELDINYDMSTDDGFFDSFDASPYTALLVEENEQLCTYLANSLQGVFKNVVRANTAAEAIIKTRNSQPDIIVADVDLSDKSGFELCKEIKSTQGIRHIPVILLTSGNAMKQKHRSYTHGADSYISKPFEIDMLISRCKNLLVSRSIMRARYEKKSIADDMKDKAINNNDESFLINLDLLIAENISNPELGVEFLTKNMLMSRTAFYSRMRELTGKSIGQYIADYRLTQAKQMLTQGHLSVSEIAEALGFSSQRYFSTFFKDKTGQSPTEYRSNPAES